MDLPQTSKSARSPTSSMKLCLDCSRPRWTAPPPHSFSHYYPCYIITHLIICFSVLLPNYTRLEILLLQQDFTQEPLICGSALPRTDYIFPDGWNNSSSCMFFLHCHWHSSYEKTLSVFPALDLSEPVTIDVIPRDVWGQDIKGIEFPPSSLGMLFFGTQQPFCEEIQATWRVYM